MIVPIPLILSSDTHPPRRARDLPPGLWTAIEAADVVLHAGDWGDVALLDEPEARSRRLLGQPRPDHRARAETSACCCAAVPGRGPRN